MVSNHELMKTALLPVFLFILSASDRELLSPLPFLLWQASSFVPFTTPFPPLYSLTHTDKRSHTPFLSAFSKWLSLYTFHTQYFLYQLEYRGGDLHQELQNLGLLSCPNHVWISFSGSCFVLQRCWRRWVIMWEIYSGWPRNIYERRFLSISQRRAESELSFQPQITCLCPKKMLWWSWWLSWWS